jgi:hypothetical protein
MPLCNFWRTMNENLSSEPDTFRAHGRITPEAGTKTPGDKKTMRICAGQFWHALFGQQRAFDDVGIHRSVTFVGR